MTLDEVADRLYGMDPTQFVAARDDEVKAARAAGDKQLATEIGRLRRPTVAAWAVNLLARDAAEEIAALLELGTALRDAQRRLSADQLRDLTARRQQVVNALGRKAGRLAEERDRPLGEPVLREVGQTLHAALADPDVAEQVRRGTLTTAANYEGFGPADAEPSASTEPHAERTTTTRDRTPERDPDEAARRELDDALEELESAREQRDSAQSDLDRATADTGTANNRVAALREELEHAEDQRRSASAAERSARDAWQQAEHRLDRVQRWVEKARSRVPEE
nr:hypothetical protein [Nocardia sp. BMG51109]